MSKITLNIVEPGSPTPTPIDPGINPAVPNTGLFTHGIGGPEATIITVSIVAVLAVVAVVLYYRKKHNKKSKLTDAINVVKSKKQLSIPLAALAMVVSLGTLAGLLVNAGKSNTNAADGSLTVTGSSEDLTIEVGDQPVFAVLPVELTVEEATVAGYTLTTYTTSTDIVSTTNPNNKIPMVAVEEDELTALEANTWGLALDNEPASKDSKVYTTLSTDQDVPTILKSIDDYSETPANDKTTIYYGFYITPDVPKGTYEGSVINYEAEPNYITNLSFNGNGSDDGEDMDSIIIPAGTAITLPQNTYTKEGYNFTGWNTSAEGTGDTYSDEAEYTAVAGEFANVTLYAQWEEDILYMQDVATWGSSLSIGDEVVAVDNRDDKEYYVARLADGNIWMTQNLDHDIGDIDGGTYTPTDTDIPVDWTPSGSEYTKSTSDINWVDSNTTPESYDPGNLYWNGVIIYDQTTCEANGGTWISGGPSGQCNNVNITSPTGDSHYYLGNYYNWTAAVAMSNSTDYTSGDVNQSICPAGWRLPNRSEDKSYQNLINMQGLTAGIDGDIQSSPTYFAYNGYWRGIFGAVNHGYYWSSVARFYNGSHRLDFSGDGYLDPISTSGRGSGSSLRCVAR